MQDTELYRHLLGLVAPWVVERVELNIPGERVDVWAIRKASGFPCAECQEDIASMTHKDRAWRHLDSCHFQTILHCRVPWAERGSQFTQMFERLAIDLLQECSVAGADGNSALTPSWTSRVCASVPCMVRA